MLVGSCCWKRWSSFLSHLKSPYAPHSPFAIPMSSPCTLMHLRISFFVTPMFPMHPLRHLRHILHFLYVPCVAIFLCLLYSPVYPLLSPYPTISPIYALCPMSLVSPCDPYLSPCPIVPLFNPCYSLSPLPFYFPYSVPVRACVPYI